MTDEQEPNCKTEESANTRIGGPPDPAKCRARSSGFGDCVDCMSDQAPICKFAFSFGCGYYCQHPHRREIMLRTLTESIKSQD